MFSRTKRFMSELTIVPVRHVHSTRVELVLIRRVFADISCTSFCTVSQKMDAMEEEKERSKIVIF